MSREDFLTRAEYKEFVIRMEDEHKRQNRRIELLEKATEQNGKLLVSVERLALSMENMQKEQKDQGERLEILESRDGQKWRDISKYILTMISGLVIGYIFKQVGM